MTCFNWFQFPDFISLYIHLKCFRPCFVLHHMGFFCCFFLLLFNLKHFQFASAKWNIISMCICARSNAFDPNLLDMLPVWCYHRVCLPPSVLLSSDLWPDPHHLLLHIYVYIPQIRGHQVISCLWGTLSVVSSQQWSRVLPWPVNSVIVYMLWVTASGIVVLYGWEGSSSIKMNWGL